MRLIAEYILTHTLVPLRLSRKLHETTDQFKFESALLILSVAVTPKSFLDRHKPTAVLHTKWLTFTLMDDAPMSLKAWKMSTMVS